MPPSAILGVFIAVGVLGFMPMVLGVEIALGTWIMASVALLAHRLFRSYLLIALGLAVTGAIVAWVAGLLNYGYVTDMAVMGAILGGFWGLIISLIVGLPYYLYRRRATKPGQ
jgi:hypothetical protein